MCTYKQLVCARCRSNRYEPFVGFEPFSHVYCPRRNDAHHRTTKIRVPGARDNLCLDCKPFQEEFIRRLRDYDKEVRQRKKTRKEQKKNKEIEDRKRTDERDRTSGTKDGIPQTETTEEREEREATYRAIEKQLLKEREDGIKLHREIINAHIQAHQKEQEKAELERVARAKARQKAEKDDERRRQDSQKKATESSGYQVSSSKSSSLKVLTAPTSKPPPSQASASKPSRPSQTASSSKSSKIAHHAASSSQPAQPGSSRHGQLPIRPSTMPQSVKGKERAHGR